MDNKTAEMKRPERSPLEKTGKFVAAKTGRWFFAGMRSHDTVEAHKSSWYNVMCLTGLDYFGSLGYAPGIAALAAGLLSPPATLILVLLTLFGALPMYKRVAEQSPHGQGSISMLKDLVGGWGGKAIVLVLIGFAATDFIITITLSAADAAEHIVKNNFVREFYHSNEANLAFLHNQEGITFVLLAILCSVFLLGFKEAIKVAVLVVWSYVLLNIAVMAAGVYQVVAFHREALAAWQGNLLASFGSPVQIGFQSLILFPQLALGMSGFETGVAVMPLVKGDPSDCEEKPVGRIRNTKKLLTAAALIMSTFLLVSSIICTLLIPQADFAAGGPANGRALAFIAHKYCGHIFGTFYDISTIFILWFSGASSLAGLLSLVPRYLPKFGMAPEWARATRPLVCFFGLISFFVTWFFHASVDAQGAAYATGVLVLMTSAGVAVFMSLPADQKWHRLMYAAVSLIFGYTTIMNIRQRPEGLHIAAFFILTVFVISILSRLWRATELRARHVKFDKDACKLVDAYKGEVIHIVSHVPGKHDYTACAREARERHYLDVHDIIFLEVTVGDASEFSEDDLEITTFVSEGYHVLRCRSVSVPNAIASILMALRNEHGCEPHAYMYWTEGNPLIYVLKYLFLGEGETAPLTREILREVEPDPKKRPAIHVV